GMWSTAMWSAGRDVDSLATGAGAGPDSPHAQKKAAAKRASGRCFMDALRGRRTLVPAAGRARRAPIRVVPRARAARQVEIDSSDGRARSAGARHMRHVLVSFPL